MSKPLKLTIDSWPYLEMIIEWTHETGYYDTSAEEILTQILEEIIYEKIHEEDELHVKIERHLDKILQGEGLALGHIDTFELTKQGVLFLIMKQGIELGDRNRLPDRSGLWKEPMLLSGKYYRTRYL